MVVVVMRLMMMMLMMLRMMMMMLMLSASGAVRRGDGAPPAEGLRLPAAWRGSFSAEVALMTGVYLVMCWDGPRTSLLQARMSLKGSQNAPRMA